jgi:hypothetical protein
MSETHDEATSGDGGLWWGWILPVSKLLPKAFHDWAVRGYLRRCLEDPRFPQGRTLETLRRYAGQPDTDKGREQTRELLRRIRRGRKRARILQRRLGAPEMWGLREN